MIGIILGYNSVKRLIADKNVKAFMLKRVKDKLDSENSFPETITHNLFEINGSFHVK